MNFYLRTYCIQSFNSNVFAQHILFKLSALDSRMIKIIFGVFGYFWYWLYFIYLLKLCFVVSFPIHNSLWGGVITTKQVFLCCICCPLFCIWWGFCDKHIKLILLMKWNFSNTILNVLLNLISYRGALLILGLFGFYRFYEV